MVGKDVTRSRRRRRRSSSVTSRGLPGALKLQGTPKDTLNGRFPHWLPTGRGSTPGHKGEQTPDTHTNPLPQHCHCQHQQSPECCKRTAAAKLSLLSPALLSPSGQNPSTPKRRKEVSKGSTPSSCLVLALDKLWEEQGTGSSGGGFYCSVQTSLSRRKA